ARWSTRKPGLTEHHESFTGQGASLCLGRVTLCVTPANWANGFAGGDHTRTLTWVWSIPNPNDAAKGLKCPPTSSRPRSNVWKRGKLPRAALRCKPGEF